MLIDIVFSALSLKGAKGCFDNAFETATAKNTAGSTTNTSTDNTNTSKTNSKQTSGTKVYKTGNEYTNGKYRMSSKGNSDHTTNSLYTKPGETSPKSRFMFGVDDIQATFDAAEYADINEKWVNNKAKIFVEDGYIGVLGDGEPTQWITVSRTDSGYIHAWPSHPSH